MGIFDDIFGSEDVDVDFAPETPAAGEAREFLRGQISAGTPDFPVRQIADLSDLEQTAISLATEFANAGVPADRRLTIDELTRIITGPTDVTKLPEVQAIINEVINEGNLIANRVGRGLRLSGNLSSSSGRDVLGRTVTDIMQALTSTLGGFAEGERGRKLSALELLENITRAGQSDVINRIQTASQAGQTPRQIEQSKLDATTTARLQEILFPTGNLLPVAQTILGNEPGIVLSGGGPSIFSQIASAFSGAPISFPAPTTTPQRTGGTAATSGTPAGGLPNLNTVLGLTSREFVDPNTAFRR